MSDAGDARMRVQLEDTAASLAAATASNVSALEELGPAPAAPTLIATEEALDAALAAAAPGATLLLASSLVYVKPLTLPTAVTLESVTYAERTGLLMTREEPAPLFLNGITIPGSLVNVRGVDVRHTNHSTDILTFRGARVVLERVRVLGDPIEGAKRGIAANGDGDCAIRRCYVDDCFRTDFEAQAVIAFDMAPGLVIEDCYLCGAGEGLMLGGVDVPYGRLPTHVTIRNNTITKNPAWMGTPIVVKNGLEIKGGRDVTITGNRITFSWLQAQTGYLVLFTVRNQDGSAPSTTIEDVLFEDNDLAHGCGAFSILARDNILETKTGKGRVAIGQVRPSVAMQRVTIRRNRVSDLTPKKYQNPGSVHMVQIGHGPIDLTIDANTFTGVGLNSSLFLYGDPKGERVRVTNNRWSTSTYGVVGNAAGLGQAGFLAYVNDGLLKDNTVTEP